MNESFSELKFRLQLAGFTLQDINDALPTWWTTGSEDNVDSLYEAKLVLARNLGVSKTQVLNPNLTIEEY